MSRKNAFVAGALLSLSGLISSCAPAVYTMAVESRVPSLSGLDLIGKSLSVLCVTPEQIQDSSDIYLQTDAFVAALEKEYFDNEKTIDIYSLVSETPEAYACKDSLVKYVVETGSDIVFLLQENTVYVYDSLNPDDRVLSFNTTADQSRRGSRLASPFLSQWEQGLYSFYFYDQTDWIEISSDLVDTYDWSAAVKGWMQFTDSNNMEKRACAEYNIAQACYLMGKYKLASEWLDMADSHFNLVLSQGLRSRIDARRK